MISRFWFRRLAEVVLFGCLLLVVLYVSARVLPMANGPSLGQHISDSAAISALIGCCITLGFCLRLPHRHQGAWAILIYLIVVVVYSLTIFDSGGYRSPFAPSWMAISIFAAFFGRTILGLMGCLVIFQTMVALFVQHAALSVVVEQLFFGLLPLLFGFILWHRQNNRAVDQFSYLENRLSSAEDKSDIVINTIDNGVLVISRDGMVELINPSAQRMIGWPSNDALEFDWQSVLRLVNADGRPVSESDNPIAQALATNQSTHDDTRYLLTSAERKILVSIVSSPIGNDNDGIIVVFRDITKEKAEERQQAEFISTASHEMRTPVASIEGYLGLALNPATAQIDARARNFISKAQTSVQHLGNLFQDLLDVSRAEDGRLKNEPRVIDIIKFISDIFEGLNHRATDKGLSYIYKPSVDMTVKGGKIFRPIFYAEVDPDHVREIVSNLIENAIKYTRSGGIVVDVTGDDQQVSISVSDSGIGIPAEDVPHLFQKFYRVDNSETREVGGTGLGLYLSRRLAENMGGSLRVESRYRQGSTFTLEIPRLNNQEALAKLKKLPPASRMTGMMPMQPTATPAAQDPINNNETTAAQATSS